jgi:hypothetical protein
MVADGVGKVGAQRGLLPPQQSLRWVFRCYLSDMHAHKDRVENGRLKLDEPTDLPNGTELYLVRADESGGVALLDDDGLEGAEREELLKIIDEGLADAEAGRVEDFSKLIAKMRAPS